MNTFDDEMDASEFRTIVQRLRFSGVSGKANDEGLSNVARFLGKTPRTARYYAEHGAPKAEANLLRSLDLNVTTLKRDRARLLKQIDALKIGRMNTRDMSEGGVWRDTTEEWRQTLVKWVAELENLLRSHPSGLPPQID